MSNRTLLTVDQFCERNPAFTPGSVRWSIFNEYSNGLAKARGVIRLRQHPGKRGRVLIHEERFLDWAIGETGTPPAAA